MFTAHSQRKHDAEMGGGLRKVSPSGKMLFHLGKRFFDILASLFAGTILLMPILILMILIRLDSPGPALFCQQRVGKNGKPFMMYKLRSMYMDAEDNGPKMAEENDSRCTCIGAFLRKYHLDELPQLWNILKNEMSFVGPRPERAYFYGEISMELPQFYKRLNVKPGLTGWAQVKGSYHTPPKEKLIMDLYYMEHMSWKMDLYCLWLTAMKLLRREKK